MGPVPRALRWTSLLVVVGTAQLSAQEYHLDHEGERRVVFESRAAIERFEGVTERIDGFVVLDGAGLREGTSFPDSELYFEVDLASLDTGIGLRNRHMRDNYLEVERFPYATFSGAVSEVSASGAGWLVLSRGVFTVHGVEQPRSLECSVRSDGAGYLVECGFGVNLGDHDIEIPRVMFLKLAEDVRVAIAFRLRPATLPQDS